MSSPLVATIRMVMHTPLPHRSTSARVGRERNSILFLGQSDQQLQGAYLSDARMGIEGASAEVFAATDAALREQLRDNLEGLADLGTRKVLGARCPRCLVRRKVSET